MDAVYALCRLSSDDQPRCLNGALAWLCHRLQHSLPRMSDKYTLTQRIALLVQLVEHGALQQPVLRSWLCSGSGSGSNNNNDDRMASLPAVSVLVPWLQNTLTRQLHRACDHEAAVPDTPCALETCETTGLPPLLCLYRWARSSSQRAQLFAAMTATMSTAAGGEDHEDTVCEQGSPSEVSTEAPSRMPFFLPQDSSSGSGDLQEGASNAPHWLRDILPAQLDKKLYIHCVSKLLGCHTPTSSSSSIVASAAAASDGTTWCGRSTSPESAEECVTAAVLLLLGSHLLQCAHTAHLPSLSCLTREMLHEVLIGTTKDKTGVCKTQSDDVDHKETTIIAAMTTKAEEDTSRAMHATLQVWASLVYVAMTGHGVVSSYVRSVLEPPDAALLEPVHTLYTYKMQCTERSIQDTTETEKAMETVGETKEVDRTVEAAAAPQLYALPLFTPTLADVVQLYSSSPSPSPSSSPSPLQDPTTSNECERSVQDSVWLCDACTMTATTVCALCHPRPQAVQLEYIWELALACVLSASEASDEATHEVRQEEMGHRLGALYDTMSYMTCHGWPTGVQPHRHTRDEGNRVAAAAVKKEEEAEEKEEAKDVTEQSAQAAPRWTLRLVRPATSTSGGIGVKREREREEDETVREAVKQKMCTTAMTTVTRSSEQAMRVRRNMKPVWSIAELPGLSTTPHDKAPRMTLSLTAKPTSNEASHSIAEVLTQAATSLMAVFAGLVPHVTRFASREDERREGHPKLSLCPLLTTTASSTSGVRLISLAVPAFVHHLQPIFSSTNIGDDGEKEKRSEAGMSSEASSEEMAREVIRGTTGVYTAFLVYRWLLECSLPMVSHLLIQTHVVAADTQVHATRCMAALRVYLAALATLRRHWPATGRGYLRYAAVSDVLLPSLLGRLHEACEGAGEEEGTALRGVLCEVKSALRELGVWGIDDDV